MNDAIQFAAFGFDDFLSCEPLVGPVMIRAWLNKLDWVITGGTYASAASPRVKRVVCPLDSAVLCHAFVLSVEIPELDPVQGFVGFAAALAGQEQDKVLWRPFGETFAIDVVL